MLKPSSLLVPLLMLLAACGEDVSQTCLVQRPFLGGFIFVMDRTGPVSGGAGCDDTQLPARQADNLQFDKLGADQREVVFRARSLLPHDANGEVDFPASTGDVGRGQIGSAPDADGICAVPSFSTANAVPALDGTPPDPPRSITLSSTRFLSAPAYQGSQAESDATYTIDSCIATYHGLLLTPVVTCGSDADCNPFADPANGRPAGSGLNPFYPVSCNMEVGTLYGGEDPGTGICWFTGNTFPQIQNQP